MIVKNNEIPTHQSYFRTTEEDGFTLMSLIYYVEHQQEPIQIITLSGLCHNNQIRFLGKGESIWDHLVHTRPELVKNRDTGDVACDSFHLFKEDVALLKSLGVYRFSISWPRILPKGDMTRINRAGIKYYHALIDELLANGIQPMVTMYHWDLPLRMQDIGGWANPMITHYMRDYARVLFKTYGEKVKLWITINEPLQIISGYADMEKVSKAPALHLDSPANYIVAYNLLITHANIYKLYNEQFRSYQNGKVAITIETSYFKQKTSSAVDKEATARAWAFNFELFTNPIFSENGDFPELAKTIVAENSRQEGRRRSRLPELTKEEIKLLKGSSDFFGLNHYFATLCSDAGQAPFKTLADKDRKVKFEVDPKWPKNAANWPVVPEGLREVLLFIKTKYKNPPVFITENGFGSRPSGVLNDVDRVRYFRDYLLEVLNAKRNYDCNVIGYTAWSLLDNFEWNFGYDLRFGIVDVNFTNPERKRTPKLSAKFFQQLLKTRVLPK